MSYPTRPWLASADRAGIMLRRSPHPFGRIGRQVRIAPKVRIAPQVRIGRTWRKRRIGRIRPSAEDISNTAPSIWAAPVIMFST